MTGNKKADAGKIDVAYVARLARLRLTDDEAKTFQAQLDQILAYMRQIGRLDLATVKPALHHRMASNVFRKDQVNPGLDRDEVMGNAPQHSNGQFIVPKIVE